MKIKAKIHQDIFFEKKKKKLKTIIGAKPNK